MSDASPSADFSSGLCVVTGANRGLGLEFCRRLAASGARVVGACRAPDAAEELRGIGGVSVVALDVGDAASVASFPERLDAAGLAGPVSLLVNNAGVYGPRGDGQAAGGFDADAAEAVLRVNVLGPVRLTEALLNTGRLTGGARVVNLSSGYARLGNAKAGWPAAYCASKAALNMIGRVHGADLKKKGVTLVSLSPGHVRTDMGGGDAPLSPERSVGNMLDTIAGLTPEDAGRFLNHNGHGLSW